MESKKKAARVERLKKMFAPGPEAIDYKVTPGLDTILKWFMFTATILGVSVITSKFQAYGNIPFARYPCTNRDEAHVLRNAETYHVARRKNNRLVCLLRSCFLLPVFSLPHLYPLFFHP